MKSARNVARVSLARLPSDPTRCYASTNRRSRQATYPAVCSKRATLLGNVDRANGRLQRARNRTSGWNVKWPAVRAWGLIPLPNIGLMGGESGPLGRRHSGRGRAVPVRCPSIVRSSLRLCGCTCPCPARRGERVVQSWSPRYVLEPPWRTRSSCPASNLSVNPMWPVCRAPLCGASMTSVRAICHKRPNERLAKLKAELLAQPPDDAPKRIHCAHERRSDARVLRFTPATTSRGPQRPR